MKIFYIISYLNNINLQRFRIQTPNIKKYLQKEKNLKNTFKNRYLNSEPL